MKTFVGLLCRDAPPSSPWILKTEVFTYMLLGEPPPSLRGALVQVAGTLRSNATVAPGTQGAIEVRTIKRVQAAQP